MKQEWLSTTKAATAYGVSKRTLRRRAALPAEHAQHIERRMHADGSGFEYLYVPAAEVQTIEAALSELLRARPAEEADEPQLVPDRPRLIAWASDIHVPEHDEPAVRAFLAWVRDAQPDEVILGGDILELGSCSEHGGVANPPALIDDVKAGRKFLAELREAAPNAVLTYLEGNHETRLKRVVVHKLATFHGAVDIPNLLDFASLKIAWVPWGKYVQRGKLRFVHGLYAGEHHAAQHLRRFGFSVVYGHTHRAQVWTRATADLEMQGAFGMPSLRTLDPEWTAGGPTGWGHGFGAIYVLPDGSFTPYLVIITRGTFVWAGKLYDGREP